MLYFHVPNHVYLASYNDNFIVLDLLKDQYKSLSKKDSVILDVALKNQFEIVGGTHKLYPSETNINLPVDFDKSIEILKEYGVLDTKYYTCPYNSSFIRKKTSSSGVSDTRWGVLQKNQGFSVPIKLIIEAYITLFKVNLTLKIMGFAYLIKKLKNIPKDISSYALKDEDSFKPLVVSLNKAWLLFPQEIACLEWSMALVLMALRRKWKCNLTIGVQTFPFYAHAWVEAGGKIIAESPEFSQKMSIILSEPFK